MKQQNHGENNMSEVFYDGGIDINSNCTFQDGDLLLVKYEDNLCQAIVNRLNTSLDELSLFYEDYGSILKGFFGEHTTKELIGFMESELNVCLSKDPRIDTFTSDISYTGDGALKIGLNIKPTTGTNEINMNLVLNTLGELEIENDEE